jgi:SAM-dependent methyltransferase
MPSSLLAAPKRLARRLRLRLQRQILGDRGLHRVVVNRPHAGGVMDAVETAGDGTAMVVGWSADERLFADGLRLIGHGLIVEPAHVFRVLRPDLARLTGSHPDRLGIVVEFVLPQAASGLALQLMDGDTPLVPVQMPDFAPPDYGQLFGNPGVWHRQDLYGVGPPMSIVSQEILDLCSDLDGPLLDFGCGAGALVSRLRAGGLDARGLELDTPTMRGATLAGAAGHVTFYDGAMPAPFADGAFASVTCCEVLEHIPEYQAAISEIARLARHRVLLTVPDMSSIPRGRAHGVVPWHLLEASHVNFFTQASLASVLAPHFRSVRFARIGEVRCDRIRFYTSLVAICAKG